MRFYEWPDRTTRILAHMSERATRTLCYNRGQKAMIVVPALKLFFARPRRAWLLTRVAMWTIILSCVLRFRSLPTALRILSGPTDRERQHATTDGQGLATAVDAVLGMNRFVFRPVCWKRAILLRKFLAEQGHPSAIVFGVRTEGGKLTGHAWLESNGSPIYESEKPDYTVTYRFPSNEVCEVDLKQMLFAD
jgi:Transglutaminase-like superfamily